MTYSILLWIMTPATDYDNRHPPHKLLPPPQNKRRIREVVLFYPSSAFELTNRKTRYPAIYSIPQRKSPLPSVRAFLYIPLLFSWNGCRIRWYLFSQVLYPRLVSSLPAVHLFCPTPMSTSLPDVHVSCFLSSFLNTPPTSLFAWRLWYFPVFVSIRIYGQ